MTALPSALWLVLTTAMSTIDVERLHGAASALRRAHPMYGWAMFLAKVFLIHTRALLLPDRDRMRERLFRKLEIARAHQPRKTNFASLFMADRLEKELGLLSPTAIGSTRRKCIDDTLKGQKEDWDDLPVVLQRDYMKLARQKQSSDQQDQIDDIEHFTAALQLYDERKAQETQSNVNRLNSGVFTFSPDGLRRLQTTFDTVEMPQRTDLKDRMEDLEAPVRHFERLADLAKVREKLGPVPSAPKTALWVRELCRRDTVFLNCVLEFQHSPFDIEWYAVQTPLLGPQSVCLQPLKLESFDVSGRNFLLLQDTLCTQFLCVLRFASRSRYCVGC